MDSSRSVLTQNKEEISVLYQAQSWTADQVLIWLRRFRGCHLEKHQLVYQLGKWGIYKKRSRKRRQRIRKTHPDKVTSKIMDSIRATTIAAVPTDNCAESDEERFFDNLLDTQPAQASDGDLRVTLSTTSQKEETRSPRILRGPPLAASITSSRSHDLHSMGSCKRRVEFQAQNQRSVPDKHSPMPSRSSRFGEFKKIVASETADSSLDELTTYSFESVRCEPGDLAGMGIYDALDEGPWNIYDLAFRNTREHVSST